jgi:hypothetical protein
MVTLHMLTLDMVTLHMMIQYMVIQYMVNLHVATLHQFSGQSNHPDRIVVNQERHYLVRTVVE